MFDKSLHFKETLWTTRVNLSHVVPSWLWSLVFLILIGQKDGLHHIDK